MPDTPTQSCALLLSRQAMRPCASTPWILCARAATQWAAGEGLTIQTSVGAPTWDAITVTSALVGARMRLFVNDTDAPGGCPRTLCDAYGLDPTRTSITRLDFSESPMGPRDQAIVSHSDVLVPLSIRPGGTLATCIEQARVPVHTAFQIPWKARGESLCYRVPPGEGPAWAVRPGEWLFHWTRASDGPWPGETAGAYWRSVFESPVYPRDAFATLRAIAGTRIVAPSVRHMPQSTPCVSLTGKTPAAFVPLMRWRARYRQMSFEPYGIGVRRGVAMEKGVREVSYGAAGVEPWLSQGLGSISNWRDEDEYRCRGALDLRDVPASQLLCVCRTREEATRLSQETGMEAVWF